MNSKFLVLAAMAVLLVIGAGVQLAQFTGFAITGGAAAAGQASQGIQVVIDDGLKASTYSVTLNRMETAFDALKRVATPDYRMVAPSVKITSINGIKEDSEHTWIFLVNDKLPSVACDYYYPVSGDVIKFSYMTAEEAGEYFE